MADHDATRFEPPAKTAIATPDATRGYLAPPGPDRIEKGFIAPPAPPAPAPAAPPPPPPPAIVPPDPQVGYTAPPPPPPKPVDPKS